MPASAIKAAMKKYGISERRAEAFWRSAKEQYGDDYDKVAGTFWKMVRNWAHSRSKGK